MPYQQGNKDAALPLELERQINSLCAEFERTWGSKPGPRIEEYLSRLPKEARSAGLKELIAQEVDLRSAAGESAEEAEYHARFPRNAAEIDGAFALLVGDDGRPESTHIRVDGKGEPSGGQTGRREDTVIETDAPNPRRIGRFQILRVLGRGAFGVVYLAKDPKLDRLVALKAPLASRFASEEAVERVVDEARTAAKLDHPGIVSVHDVFHEDDRVVIVQQYIEGQDLREALRSGTWPPDRITELFIGLAEALAAAHQAGLVHRDLKPGNILLDKKGRPYIADFGLAIHEGTQRQRRGEVAGTWSYMAPEQTEGRAHHLDGRSDVWALGVILYQMLTQRRAFDGETVEELLEEISYRDPKPPRMIRPEVPTELERICLKCLEKRPVDRYPSASALAEELREFSNKTEGGPPEVAVLSDNRIQIANLTVVLPSVGIDVRLPETAKPREDDLGPNPYRGLGAFREQDAAFFFGREEQVERLHTRLDELYRGRTESTPRILPILGPSGCGKSSLARAGLIAELARRPLAGWQMARVAVFTPGTRPLESLANVLARVVTDDPAPVAKSREFLEILHASEGADRYEALRQIAAMFPEIDRSPLVLFVDQFEEVYTQCDDSDARLAFLENLLHAASDPSGNVSVVLTLRSDFLGETQDHQSFNGVVCEQGVIVPAMSADELRRAITEPARRSGYDFDKAVVDLLIRDTRDREGALPLLQFALTRIWEGLENGVDAAETLDRIGGVGGALAGEAERIYAALSPDDQRIVRRAFQAMVQLGEGTQDTRRRVHFEEIVSASDQPRHVREVLSRFAEPGCRLVTFSAEEKGSDVAEVTHEALFEHWKTLRDWVDGHREDIRLKRRVEEAARHWDDAGQPAGLLWRSPDLDILQRYVDRAKMELTPLQLRFFTSSVRRWRREQSVKIGSVAILGVLLITSLILWRYATGKASDAENAAAVANDALKRESVERDRAEQNLYNARIGLAWRRWLEDEIREVKNLLNLCPEQLRHWEWGYLRRLCHSDLLTIAGNASISPNGRRIVAGDRNGAVKVWDAETGKEALVLQGNVNGLRGVRFSPDGRRIVAGSGGGTLTIWDAASGKRLLSLEGHTPNVRNVAFSPNGRRIAVNCKKNTVRIWDVASGEELIAFSPFKTPIDRLLFGPNGDRIISSDRTTGTVKVSDAENGKELFAFDGNTRRNNDVYFSPDRRLFVSGVDDETSRVWNPSTGEELFSVKGHTSHAGIYAFSPNGEQLVLKSGKDIAGIWDIATGKMFFPIEGGDVRLGCVCFSPDGRRIISSGGLDVNVKVWDAKNGEELLTIDRAKTGIGQVFLSPDSTQIVSGSLEGTVKIWDAKTGKETLVLKGHEDGVERAVFIVDGRRILSRSMDGTTKLWDVTTDRAFVSLAGHEAAVESVAFSPDSRRIVTGGGETVRIWDPTTGQEELAVKPGFPVACVCFSPDGKQIASAGTNGKVTIWNASTGQELLSYKGGAEPVLVVFSKDGRRIISGGTDGAVVIRDAVTGDEIRSLKGDGKEVGSMAVSPDERHVVFGCKDGEIRIQNIATGQRQTTIKAHRNRINSVTFSPDGRLVATGSSDTTVKVWDVQTGKEVHVLKGHRRLVSAVVFSSDGRRVVSGNGKEEVAMNPWINRTTAKVWDATTGQELFTLTGPEEGVNSVAFSPDNSHIALGCVDGTVRVYSVLGDDRRSPGSEVESR